MTNKTPFDFGVENIRVFLRDRKEFKKRAMQEKEVFPENLCGAVSGCKAYSKGVIVIVLGESTLSPHHYLEIEMSEKGEGKTISLKLNRRDLLKASVVND